MADDILELRKQSQSILDKILTAQDDIKKQIIFNNHSDPQTRPMSSTVADFKLSPQRKSKPKGGNNQTLTPREKLRQKSRTPEKPRQTPFLAKESMKTPKRSILVDRTTHSPNTCGKVKFLLENSNNTSTSYHRDDNIRMSPSKRPLLGYDWVAGMLETRKSSSRPNQAITEDYLDEITEFRRANREECSMKTSNWNDERFSPIITPHRRPPSSPDPESHDPRIIDYTVNSRLFPVAVDPNAELVKPGTSTSPRFIRVSVPKSVLTTPHKFKSTGSSASADSMALSDHCVRGREIGVGSLRYPQPNVRSHLDLRSSLRPVLVEREF